jgi:hypothetical protein
MVQISLSIEARDIHTFPNKMRTFTVRLPRVTRKLVDQFGRDTVNLAKRYAPVWRGLLRMGIRHHVVDDNTADVTADQKYAWFQEAGFRPHFVSLKHPLVRQWFEEHRTGAAPEGPTARGMIHVKKYTPFVAPAIIQLAPTLGPVTKQNIEELMKSVFE